MRQLPKKKKRNSLKTLLKPVLPITWNYPPHSSSGSQKAAALVALTVLKTPHRLMDFLIDPLTSCRWVSGERGAISHHSFLKAKLAGV